MRQFKDNLLRGLLWLSAFLSVAVLVMIVGFIFYKGFGLISFDFIFGDYSPTGGGGIWPMIVTTDLHNCYFINHCNTNWDISGRLLARIC